MAFQQTGWWLPPQAVRGATHKRARCFHAARETKRATFTSFARRSDEKSFHPKVSSFQCRNHWHKLAFFRFEFPSEFPSEPWGNSPSSWDLPWFPQPCFKHGELVKHTTWMVAKSYAPDDLDGLSHCNAIIYSVWWFSIVTKPINHEK